MLMSPDGRSPGGQQLETNRQRVAVAEWLRGCLVTVCICPITGCRRPSNPLHSTALTARELSKLFILISFIAIFAGQLTLLKGSGEITDMLTVLTGNKTVVGEAQKNRTVLMLLSDYIIQYMT